MIEGLRLAMPVLFGGYLAQAVPDGPLWEKLGIAGLFGFLLWWVLGFFKRMYDDSRQDRGRLYSLIESHSELQQKTNEIISDTRQSLEAMRTHCSERWKKD